MLVLERMVNQRFRIGTSWVKILKISRGKVKLGIEAAPEIEILREEVDQRMADEPVLVEA